MEFNTEDFHATVKARFEWTNRHISGMETNVEDIKRDYLTFSKMDNRFTRFYKRFFISVNTTVGGLGHDPHYSHVKFPKSFQRPFFILYL